MSNDPKILITIHSIVKACKHNRELIYKTSTLFILMLMILILKYSLISSVYEVRLRLHIGSVYTTNTLPFWGFDSSKWRLIENSRAIVSEYKRIFGSDLQSLKTKIESNSLTLLIRRKVSIAMLTDIELISNRIINKHNVCQENYYANLLREFIRAEFYSWLEPGEIADKYISNDLLLVRPSLVKYFVFGLLAISDKTTVKYVSTEALLVGPSFVKYFVFGLLAIIVLSLLYLCSQIMNSFLNSKGFKVRLLKL